MKKNFLAIMLFAAIFINLYAQDVFRQEGIASWYGKEYDGRPTASGEIFDSSEMTCAHPSLPFGTRLVVTNQHNNKSVTVRVNDRGPFVPARIIDVSRAAAEQLDMIITGTAPVKIESIERIAISPPPTQPIVDIPPRVETAPVAPATQVVFAPETAPVAPTPQTAPVFVTAPQMPQQIPVTCVLKPAIAVSPEKTYRLQVGSYKNARNAVAAFDRLKSAGLNPAYERFMPDGNNEFFRVVLTCVRGYDIQQTVDKLGSAGFREALIREDN